jgi:drug/metabolite transporter (DMT)-like permease
MFYMIFAVGILSFMDAAMKMLTDHYSPLQVAAMRGMSSLPFALALLAWHKDYKQVLRVRPAWQLLRGALSVVTLGSFIYAIKHLNLADADCIFFFAPLLIAALSAPLLGERIEWRGWLAIVVGFGGVVWMLQPGGHHLDTGGAVAALVATVGYVLGSIVLRVVSRTDSSAASTFWFLILVSIGAGLLALPDWRMPLSSDWPWLLAMGVCGMLGQTAISEAFRLAPPALVAPFEYTALLWGILLDWFLWAQAPNTGLWGGATLVVASGLYMLWREHVLHKASNVVTPVDVACSLAPESDRNGAG